MQQAPPQFGTAEYVGKPGTDRCRFCNQTIAGQYYRVNGAMACGSCADAARRETPQDNHAAYVRGVVYGVGAAIAGLIVYSAFGIITGLIIGYVSLAVGYMVGKAMMKGSGGLGGRRYQLTAVVLTYAAVSLSAIPMGISQYLKENKEHKTAQVAKQPANAQNAESQENPTTAESQPHKSFGAAVVWLAVMGLASPFLELQDPAHGFIGLIILFVGIQIAWRLTQGRQHAEVDGPFDNPKPSPA